MSNSTKRSRRMLLKGPALASPGIFFRWTLMSVVTVLPICFLGVVTVAQNLGARVEHVERIPDVSNPEMLYWFISPSEVKDRSYIRDLDVIADNGTFNLIFLTQREGADFYDFPAMHPIFKDLVARAHARGIKVGLQLWTDDKRLPPNQAQGVVVEKELQLDSEGQADVTAESEGVRQTGNSADVPRICLRSEVLRAFAFRKTGDGQYDPGSVIDVTPDVQVTGSTACSVTVHVQASRKLAGDTVYLMTVHYHRYPDMFSDYMSESFIDAMRNYKDVGFNGAALDEFGYIALHKNPKERFHDRLYTENMARFFKKRTGQDLVRVLFDMRYAPSGNPLPRIRAINNYFDVLRLGPLRVEEKFYQATADIFGPQAFHGIHNTFHNHLTNDEIWTTCINWWDVPRDYGQTDEGQPMTTELGIGLAHPKPVEYDQHYGTVMSFLEEGIRDARYNVRIHYHALNDQHHWGTDMGDPEMLRKVTALEDKVRLLNWFSPPRPSMNVLYIFGYPALANWFPVQSQRNDWDINGSLNAEEKAVTAWNAGYRGAFVSSNLIQERKITSDDHGGILYGGQRFTALVFIGPEYSKRSTLQLLEKFTAGGGRLMLDGKATKDFSADDITARFDRLSRSAVATAFSVEAMDKLGVPKLAMADGAVYEDGSVVLTDLDSLLSGRPKPFSIELHGHHFTGSYVGLLAIQSDPAGNVLKLAGGGIRELDRDGKPAVIVSDPSDLVLLRAKDGAYREIIRGDATVTIQ